MSDVTPTTITADGVAKIFGKRHPAGRQVEVFTVDGFSFPTREAADTFTASPFPRTLFDGRLVTSDGVTFPASKVDQAAARQVRIDQEAGK